MTDSPESLEKPIALEPQQSDEPSSLWKAVYEHPVEAGLVVGAAAAATAALILSRGRVARLFNPKNDVLVVEAAPYMGKAMKTALKEQGHAVTWVTEISNLRPLRGLTPEGTEIGLNLRRFHTAFLDPNHVHKGVPEVADLVPAFRHHNVRTIGTSVMDDINQKLLAGGVDAAGTKPVVLASIVGKKLDLTQFARNPNSAQQVFDWLKPRLNAPELTAIRDKTSDLLAKSM